MFGSDRLEVPTSPVRSPRAESGLGWWEGTMALGYEGSLYLLAFDHRGSFQKAFFGIVGEPNPEEAAKIVDAKRLIFEGLLGALREGAPLGSAGVLVDEQFGAGVARETKEKGLLLAMPVERSGG